MVNISSQVKWNQSVLGRLQAAAKVNSVSVGYEESEEYPNGTKVGDVAWMQEFGTPKIPPRPFIRPTIDRRKGHWFRKIRDGIVHAFTEDQFKAMYADIGKAIQVNLQQSIDRVTNPSLSDYTKERRKAKGNSSVKPLVDSGKMRDSIAYKVGEEGDWQK